MGQDKEPKAVREFFKKRFSHPLSQGLDIDSPEAVRVHSRIIRENRLLNDYYRFVYAYFKKTEETLSGLDLPSLEIGSGGGFLKEFLPAVITSDVVLSEGIDRVENAVALSFGDRSLKAIYANGVIHHLKDPGRCLAEVQRVLAPGGKFVCNEPSSTLFGYFMNKVFHHEYTDRRAPDWKREAAEGERRLTEANMAAPYIIFKRDAGLFKERFPNLRIASIVYHDFLRYTLSGGLSFRPFVPPALFGAVNAVEAISKPLMSVLGNEMLVTIQKI